MRKGYSLFDSAINAKMFLLKTFLSMIYRADVTRQLHYLIKENFMSDLDWELHFQCKLKGLKLGEGTIN